MKVYRVYDNEKGSFVKIGKRTNDIYVSKQLLTSAIQRHYRIDNIDEKFKIIEYELIRTVKS